MLKVNNLYFAYDDKNPVFENLSIQLSVGEIIWLKGENGVGKSTLLRIIAQLLESKGEIKFIDKVNGVIKNQELKTYISYIPDNPYLFEYLTGYENARFLRDLFCIPKAIFEEVFYDNIKRFSLLDDLNKPVRDYSLGMRHKLFWAVMFSRDSKVILLDEPFTALDKSAQYIASKIIEEQASSGSIILFVSHMEEVSQALATQSYELYSGQLLENHMFIKN